LAHPVYLGVHVANDLKKDEIKNKPDLLNYFYGRVVEFLKCACVEIQKSGGDEFLPVPKIS
jgi:hypothetical protein